MSNNFASDILGKLSTPHVFFPQDTIIQKKALAWHITSLSGEEILLASSFAFSYDSVIAGLTVSQIEHFAKYAPENYRKKLASFFINEVMIQEAFEIAKMMDEDMGAGVTRNQKRIEDVRRYVMDNWIVFQF